ncbi:MAG TPA: filamentous hemagglutinin N-terminal domain-containing protein, partial [Burkholderiales bacterium]|nr:filamentous hemagglutinin N-terminal domain-containing protein [Burkholderiales bacterium]
MQKQNGVRAALRGKRVAVAVAAAFVPLGEAYSLPTGENLVHGDVQVTRPTAQMMQINQGTQKGIVNWQGFSIGGSEHVNITQPSSSASLLNRVVGNDPSNIFGRLTANGQVFLVNNAGVFFAPGASVNAAAIVASTLSITDQNFLDNTYQFFNPGNAGSVANQGSIVTAGGFTALIGPQVRNDGIILANSGKIALGAGNRVSLDMIGDGLVSISVDEAAFNASVINTGTLQADGGTVMLKASSANALLDTVINTSGLVRANSLIAVNGEIILDGGGAVQVAGTVEAIGGAINVSADSSLNVGSTVCCTPTQVTAGTQTIEAGSITVGGGASVTTTSGSQTVTTPGTLLVRGGVLSGGVGLFHNGSGEQRITAANLELRGGSGTNTGAFINSQGGGDQTLTVTGELRVTGGASGIGNRAGIVSTGNQTINGNPDIVLTGGAGGGAGNNSNNVFIQATGPDTTQQTINARTIQINAGAGTDASATINAARQVISTLGNVSLFGGGGLGGASNGARIGGIGGTTLGPT